MKFRTNRCNKSSQAFPKTLVNFGYSRWYGQNKVNNLLQGWINIASEHWTTTVGNKSQSMQCPNLHTNINYHNAVNYTSEFCGHFNLKCACKNLIICGGIYNNGIGYNDIIAVIIISRIIILRPRKFLVSLITSKLLQLSALSVLCP